MVELSLSLFLKGDDIKDEDELEFLDEGEENLVKQKDGSEKKMFSVEVKLPSGEHRIWTMNPTSQRTVASKYGVQTLAWVGKKIQILKVKQNVKGEIKDVIYAKGEK